MDEHLMGKMVGVEIVSSGKYYMEGKVLNDLGSPSIVPPLLKGTVSGEMV